METTEATQPFGADIYPLVTEEMYNPNALVTLRYINPETNENTYRLYKATNLEEKVHVQLATFEAQIETLRETLNKNRNRVTQLYGTLNSNLEENELTEDDTITYGELSEIIESVFGNPLSFMRDYEAYVTFKVSTRVSFKASSADDAQAIADSISLDVSDHDISYDGDAEVEEVYVDETEVESVETTN